MQWVFDIIWSSKLLAHSVLWWTLTGSMQDYKETQRKNKTWHASIFDLFVNKGSCQHWNMAADACAGLVISFSTSWIIFFFQVYPCYSCSPTLERCNSLQEILVTKAQGGVCVCMDFFFLFFWWWNQTKSAYVCCLQSSFDLPRSDTEPWNLHRVAKAPWHVFVPYLTTRLQMEAVLLALDHFSWNIYSFRSHHTPHYFDTDHKSRLSSWKPECHSVKIFTGGIEHKCLQAQWKCLRGLL